MIGYFGCFGYFILDARILAVSTVLRQITDITEITACSEILDPEGNEEHKYNEYKKLFLDVIFKYDI